MATYLVENLLSDPWTGVVFACPGNDPLSRGRMLAIYLRFMLRHRGLPLNKGTMYLIPEHEDGVATAMYVPDGEVATAMCVPA
jgi:hypothetical protein